MNSSKKLIYADIFLSFIFSIAVISVNAEPTSNNSSVRDTTFLLGIEKLENEDYNGAIVEFNKIIAISRTYLDPAPFINRGIAYQKLGQLDNAINDYVEALKFEYDRPLAHFNLGLAYLVQKKYEQANSHLNQSLIGDPDLIAARRALIEVHKNLSKIEPAKKDFWLQVAIQDCDLILRVNPNDNQVYFEKALLSYELKNYSLAADNFQKALAEGYEPKDEIYSNIGSIFLLQDKLMEAIPYLDRAIAENNSNADYFHNRAIAYIKVNEKEKALGDFRQASVLYRKAGRIDKAEQEENHITHIINSL